MYLGKIPNLATLRHLHDPQIVNPRHMSSQQQID